MRVINTVLKRLRMPMVLLTYDLHLLLVHTATMNLNFRKCIVHFF